MKTAAIKGKTVGFRPVPIVQERLEYAEKIGVNAAEMINGLIEKYGRKFIEDLLKDRERRLRETMQMPIP